MVLGYLLYESFDITINIISICYKGTKYLYDWVYKKPIDTNSIELPHTYVQNDNSIYDENILNKYNQYQSEILKKKFIELNENDIKQISNIIELAVLRENQKLQEKIHILEEKNKNTKDTIDNGTE